MDHSYNEKQSKIMISWIEGKIIQKEEGSLFIASQSLGFEILLGKKILENFKLGQTISLFVLVLQRKRV